MKRSPLPRIIRPRQAAESLSLSESALKQMRMRGEGPEFVRLGNRLVGYRVESVERWLEQQTRKRAAS
jgi:predicted DNA-binding transcriptional regulator AlpA